MNIVELSEELLVAKNSYEFYEILYKWVMSLTMNDIKIGKIKYSPVPAVHNFIKTRSMISIQNINMDWNYVHYCGGLNDQRELAFTSLIECIYDELVVYKSDRIINEVDSSQTRFETQKYFFKKISGSQISKDFIDAYEAELIKIYKSDEYKDIIQEKYNLYVQNCISKLYKDVVEVADSNFYTEDDIEQLMIKAIGRARIARILK